MSWRLVVLPLVAAACARPPVESTQPLHHHAGAESTVAGHPFAVARDGNELEQPVGCFMTYSPEWTVMTPDGQGDPCSMTGEDDFAASFDLPVCSITGDGPACPLPAPGRRFRTRLQVARPFHAAVPATVTVLRHERPYVIVSISTSLVPAGVTIGGELKIKLEGTASALADQTSWR